MACRNFFTIFNIVLCVIGLGLAGIGIWLLAESDLRAYLYVFGYRPGGANWLFAACIICMLCGAIQIGIGILAIFGVRQRRLTFIGVYISLMLLIIILEIVAGFLVVAHRRQIPLTVKDNMLHQLQYYEWENDVGLAWNRVQVRRICCGVESSKDYRCTDWWKSREENEGVECPDYYWLGGYHVPKSCCTRESNQNPDHIDPQDPVVLNEERCQEDAMGDMGPGSSYLHGDGCYTKVGEYIILHMDILIGVSLGTAAIQTVGFVSGIVILKLLAKLKRVEFADMQGTGRAAAYAAKKVEYQRPAGNL